LISISQIYNGIGHPDKGAPKEKNIMQLPRVTDKPEDCNGKLRNVPVGSRSVANKSYIGWAKTISRSIDRVDERRDSAADVGEDVDQDHDENPEKALRNIEEMLQLIVGPGQVVEMRALDVNGGDGKTYSGYYDADHLDELARDAIELSKGAKGVYITLNPVRRNIIEAGWNECDVARKTTKDEDILGRKWLLIDVDPTRSANVGATEDEKKTAADVISAVMAYLGDVGWPEPLFCDSGNGYHLLYRIDLPIDDGGLVKRVLERLDRQFSTDEARIDKAVFNPSRITKLYGTKVRKGADTADRPHRYSKILEIPPENRIVERSLLESVAAWGHSLIEGQPPRVARAKIRIPTNQSILNRARAYVTKMGAAISGQHGHDKTYHVACTLILGFDLSVDESMPIFKEWNATLDERWTERELRHKLEDANKEDDERGYLVVDEADDDPFRLAKVFLNENYGSTTSPSLRCWRQDWYEWDGTAYRLLPEGELRAKVSKGIKKEFNRIYPRQLDAWEKQGSETRQPRVLKVTQSLVNNVLQALASITLIAGAHDRPCWLQGQSTRPRADEIVAAKNNLVHLPSLIAGGGGTLEHTPDFFTGSALDYPINLQAKPPERWLGFLHQLWPDDPESIETLREWFGYCLLPDTSQQKILFVLGPKRSGKGTIGRVLTGLLGAQNVVGPTFSSLTTNFGLSPLLGKNLAIISDARLSGRADQAVITERLLAISGEDLLTVDRKNREPISVKLPTRLMILTNELPRLADSSGALTSRLINLLLKTSFYGKEDHALTTDLLGERAGIFLWAVEGLKRLRERGHFCQPQSAEDISARLTELSSPVTAFIEEFCEVGTGVSVAKQALYFSWKQWCENHGHEPGSTGIFGRNLIAACPDIDTIRENKGNRSWMYQGIGLKEANHGAF
jgi:putative DNA primase/helicase